MLPRHQHILDLARAEGQVLVDALAEQFNVSPQTIRKDLNELCDKQLLFRTHGGAILSSHTENLEYARRGQIAAPEKQAIARIVADLIPQRASLFINIGTTTEAVSQALLEHERLMVITNNINVANIMRPHEHVEVMIACGLVRGSDGGIVGEAAVDFIRQFKTDYAIISASAVDQDGTLMDYDYREVKVSQAIIQNARNVILVADSSKFERSAPVRICALEEIDTFVTGDGVPKGIETLCATHNVTLIKAT
ncbi:DeoR/GlpR family DNA-binding transcription regulator [Coralliovum pocilloporae]|uniref:DeoR/GlpR family DNA-binding transcription regulator n=1 Tax=Coralliovum pocilloporae TaxID=3066369 RepID=UPI00330780CA